MKKVFLGGTCNESLWRSTLATVLILAVLLTLSMGCASDSFKRHQWPPDKGPMLDTNVVPIAVIE